MGKEVVAKNVDILCLLTMRKTMKESIQEAAEWALGKRMVRRNTWEYETPL